MAAAHAGLGRVLGAAYVDLWLAGAALVLWDAVHDHGDVGAAAPPRRLAWSRSAGGSHTEGFVLLWCLPQLSQVAFLHIFNVKLVVCTSLCNHVGGVVGA